MANDSYHQALKKDFGELIGLVDLQPLQKHFFQSRWLDQLLWNEGKAALQQRRHYVLRVVAIVGGVLLPALVSLDVRGTAEAWVRWLAFGVGLVVAVAVAIEGFFRFGDRWRHHRRTAELLKIEGWQFLQLAGPYQGHQTHADAFGTFVAHTETIIQQDLDTFISTIAVEKTDAAAHASPTANPTPSPAPAAPRAAAR